MSDDHVCREPQRADVAHVVNEWADLGSNALQWLRNIKDGISTADDALAEMKSNYERVLAMSRASLPSPAGNVETVYNAFINLREQTIECHRCDGHGHVVVDFGGDCCPVCGGAGALPKFDEKSALEQALAGSHSQPAIPAGSEQEEEDREQAEDAAANLRLIDFIADTIGLPKEEELSQHNFAAWLQQRSQPASAWQPIETAPHEERVLLGWVQAGTWFCETGMASHGWRRGGISTMSRHGYATHWQPLPEGPRHD